MTVPPESLARQSLRDIMWTYVGVAVHAALQIAGSVALARILGPEPFGVFAIVMIVCGPLRLLGELGLGSALIQKERLGEDDLSLVFSRLMVAGILIAISLFLLGPHLSTVYGGSASTTASLCVVSVVFLLYPLSIVCSSLLSRELNRKRIQLISVLGYVIGYLGVGVFGAVHGWGALSLAGGFVCQNLIQTCLLFAIARPPLRWRWHGTLRPLWAFGLRATGINALTWLVGIMDNLIVAKMFGASDLGIYSVAYNVVRTPTDQLVVTVQNVLLPASARIQSDNGRVGRGYLAALDAVVVCTAPMFAGLAAVSGTFVAALYGEHWSTAAVILVPLALAMPLHAINAVSSAVLWGSGNVARELRLQFLVAAAFVVIVGGLAQFSLAALAWGVFVVYALRALWMILTVASALGISTARVFASIRTGIGMAPVVGISLAVVDASLRTAGLPAAGRLCIEVCGGGLVFLLSLLALGRHAFSNELRTGLSILFVKMPRPIRKWTAARGA
jgi:O-antigen/teichoic acid export membrane protein